MRPSLLPRLVNGLIEDPALFNRILFDNRAILFDLGDIHALSTRNILYSSSNIKKIISIAKESDQLYTGQAQQMESGALTALNGIRYETER